jgi:hypothetical protein
MKQDADTLRKRKEEWLHQAAALITLACVVYYVKKTMNDSML